MGGNQTHLIPRCGIPDRDAGPSRSLREIINCQCAPKGNLPKYLTKPLLAAYVKKCQLKAADMDHTPEYQNAKAIVNSFYGMCVQRLVFVDWYFDPEDHKRPWHDRVSKVPYWRQIQDKLLSPYWGIWVTAWARYKLLSVVHQLDPDKRKLKDFCLTREQ